MTTDDDTRDIELLSKHWMSDPAAKDRRMLLVTSLVGLLVAYTGLLPSKVTTLGITFDGSQQNAFLWAIAGTIFYLVVAFWARSSLDRHARYRLLTRLRQINKERRAQRAGDDGTELVYAPRVQRSYSKVLVADSIVVYYFPLVLGVVALGSVIARAFRS